MKLLSNLSPQPVYAVAAALAVLLTMGAYPIRVHAGDSGALVDVVELRQTQESLSDTYQHNKNKRMSLPRLVMLDGQGRAVLGEAGYRDGLGYRLERALKQDKPLSAPITLEMVLAETEDAQGKPVATESLPKADAYVVDYWAEWCAPCRMISRDLEKFFPRWNGVHVVWIKVDSDPSKLPKKAEK